MTFSDDQLRTAFAKSVYFHAVGGPLSHNAGCLIEGSIDLGIPVKICAPEITSRPASMPLKGIDLAQYVSPPYAGLSGYIIDISHTNSFVSFDGAQDGRVAYLNQSDISIFCRIPDEHLLFVGHESLIASKGGLRRPIAFGLSNGLISATENRPDSSKRKRMALRNFRATLSQSVRALLDMSFVPGLEKCLPIDRATYAPESYMEAILGSMVCLAYGGDFYAPIASNPWFKKNDPALADMHDFERFDAPALVQRWDSFRLWESFAAECLTVHLNFEKYGFALPEMPIAWEHYAPIDLGDIAGSVTEIMDREKEWSEIAAKGRAWAIAHYAPKPTAARTLSEMLAHTGSAA
jgi:hypothetical protein